MTKLDEPSIFLDTNILVYANVEESPFHQVALQTIEKLYQAGVELWISRQVLREYLSTLTRPKTFASPQPVATVIARVRYFSTRFQVAQDDAQITERLLKLIEEISIGGKQVHDANIVATMQVYGIEQLLTHNVNDFERFSNLITLVPLLG
jgi:predicted nucleic acid-binding protein